MPQLSIITPLKNAEPWLVACITSVQVQSFTDWEWIVIDDHSEDASLEVISKAAQKDSRIKVYNNQGDGIIEALQIAFNLTTGKFITRMDADDIMPPARLEKLLDRMYTSSPKTVITGLVKYFGDDVISEGYLNYEAWLNSVLRDVNPWQHIYRECIIASPNWIMRTEEMRQIGGFQDLEYPEDYHLCFRLYQHNFSISCLPEVSLKWREHPNRTSRNSEHYQQNAFFSLKIKQFLNLDYHKDRPLCIWGSGKKAKLTGRLLSQYNISHLPMVLAPSSIIGSKASVPYTQIEKLERPQILLAVYPPKEERVKLEAYLAKHQLIPGRDYWYL